MGAVTWVENEGDDGDTSGSPGDGGNVDADGSHGLDPETT